MVLKCQLMLIITTSMMTIDTILSAVPQLGKSLNEGKDENGEKEKGSKKKKNME